MRVIVVLVSVSVALVLGACGSDDDEGVGPVPIETTTTVAVPTTPGSPAEPAADGSEEDTCMGIPGSCESKREMFRSYCASESPNALARKNDAESTDPEDIAEAVAEVSVTDAKLEDIAKEGCLEGLAEGAPE